MRRGLAPFPALLALALAGCGSLNRLNRPALPAYEAGDFQAASDRLAPLPKEGGSDRLLALYERGMILHAARRFEDSNAALLEAAKLAESIELISIAERSGTLVTNENWVDYRGEDHDRVLCHTLAAMNYLALGSVQEALVECRRMLEVHKMIREKREKDDRINAFALFLSGLCWELGGQPNDAIIDYKACHELAPSFPPVREGLLRLTERLGMKQEHAQWVKEFGGEAPPIPPGTGEAVVLYEVGLAPEKTPGGPLGILPALVPRPSATAAGRVLLNGTWAADTLVLNDVEAWVRATLAERELLLMAKRMAILAAREATAREVERKHGENAGFLARLFFFAIEKPDLRCWSTLPKTFQACRVRVPAGVHDLSIQPVDEAGAPSASPILFPGTAVKPGQIVILIARTVS